MYHSATIQSDDKLGEHSRVMIGKKRADLELPLVGAVGGGLAVELVDGDLDLPQQQTHSAGVGGDVQDLTVLDVQHKTVTQHHRHTDTQHRTDHRHMDTRTHNTGPVTHITDTQTHNTGPLTHILDTRTHGHTDVQHRAVNTHHRHTDTQTH